MTRNMIILLIICAGWLHSTQLHAQRDQGKDEKIQQIKIAFITEKMNLSPEEAQRFWPIYNKYDNKLALLKEQRRNNYKGNQVGDHNARRLDPDTMTDAEAQAKYTLYLNIEKQKLDLTQQMITELEGSFSSKQILNYLIAEERFKRQVISKVKEKMKENRGNKEMRSR